MFFFFTVEIVVVYTCIFLPLSPRYRFSYDWNRDVRVKEEGKFEFPLTLSMKPYCTDDLNRDGLFGAVLLFSQRERKKEKEKKKEKKRERERERENTIVI